MLGSAGQGQGQAQKPRVVQYAKPDVRRTKEYKSLARRYVMPVAYYGLEPDADALEALNSGWMDEDGLTRL